MTEKQVIREAMTMRGWSQSTLAQEAGFKSQSNITGLLNNNQKGIRMDNLLKIFNALGCEIIVRDKMGSKKEWMITGEDTVSAEQEASKPKKKEKKSVTNPETGKIVLSPTEDLIRAGYLTVQQAMERGWKPTPEFLDYILNNEGGNTNADA